MASSSAVVERREFMLVCAGGALFVAGSGRAAAQQADASDFAALMQALEAIGDQLPVDTQREQDAYVLGLASRAIRVGRFPFPETSAIGDRGIQIRPLGRTQPPSDSVHGVALVSYRMAPGAVLQAHNHPHYSVATVGVEGEARVLHYEPPAAAPPFSSTADFIVRQTAERVLRPGEATTLSPLRDNIHTFAAGPQGARFVDLFSLHGRDIGFSYLDIEPRPISNGGDRFRAVWAGKTPHPRPHT